MSAPLTDGDPCSAIISSASRRPMPGSRSALVTRTLLSDRPHFVSDQGTFAGRADVLDGLLRPAGCGLIIQHVAEDHETLHHTMSGVPCAQVRTGVFSGPAGTNSDSDPAHLVVEDVEEAVAAGLHRARSVKWHSMR